MNSSPELLTLKQLHEALTAQGVELSYKTLSEFTGTGDIREQLHGVGTNAKRLYPPDAADVLAAFLPRYTASHGRLPQAAEMLRAFLKSGSTALVPQFSGSTELVKINGEKLDTEFSRTLELAQWQGWAAQDRLLTAKEAADYLQVSVRSLRKHFNPAFRIGKAATGDRWRLSNLLAGPDPAPQESA